MPPGRNCRTCGASLPPDLGWCTTCFTPVSRYSARAPIHERGGYAGPPTPTQRTSRWRAGPTSFGPAGRIFSTMALAALFPWWGLGGFNPFFLWALMGWLMMAAIVLRSVWKRERVVDRAPTRVERRIERFRADHPILGRELHLAGSTRAAILVVAAGAATTAWLSLDDAARYAWAVVALVSGVGIFLARWNEL